jgi:hypothetical protein
MQEKIPYLVRGARIIRKYADGYFTLRLPSTQRQAHFCLEIDQGTMTNPRWQEKVKAYQEFRQSGQSERQWGTRNFRVLAVTTSERRLTNLKKATEQARGDHFFWFTTFEKVNIWEPETILDAVWLVATKDSSATLFLTSSVS